MKTSRIIVKPNNFEAIIDDYDIYQFEYDYTKIQPKGLFIKVEDIQGRERSELNAQSVAFKNNKTCLENLQFFEHLFEFHNGFINLLACVCCH